MGQYKFLRKLAIVIGAAVALAGNGVARADTSYTWGVHDASEYLTSAVAPGSFQDTISFSISDYLVLETSTTVANENPPGFNIADGSYAVLNMGANNAIGGYDDILLGSWAFDGTTGETQHSVVLATGNYYIAVKGVADGVSGGIYALTSNIAPIPEPEIFAMMAAGLGLMGFVARRRKQGQVAA